jgi:hypothetical protein
MSRLIFAAVASLVLSTAGAAQEVPARDLLQFPLGLVAEPPGLSTRMVGGLWNPAAIALPRDSRIAFGVAGLTTDQNQGVQLDMFGLEYRLRSAIVGTLTFAQASVADVLRTETDPTTTAEIPYGTSVLSIGAAGTKTNLAGTKTDVTIGLAGRFRWATLDTDHSSVFGFDAGVLADHAFGFPVRVSASTFLFSPSRSRESATYMYAADVPVYKRDTTLTVRAGYAGSKTDHRGVEDYGFATITYRVFDASVGYDRSSVFSDQSSRIRMGIGLHYAGYTVAVGREDGAAGFGPSYQFILTRSVR